MFRTSPPRHPGKCPTVCQLIGAPTLSAWALVSDTTRATPAFTSGSYRFAHDNGRFRGGFSDRLLLQRVHQATCSDCEKNGGFLNFIYKGLAAYFQDEWKASRRLTVTMGVRYDYNFAPLEEQDHQGWWDEARGGGLIAADKTIFDKNLQGDVLTYAGGRTYGTVPKNVFAPRIGIAFRPFGDRDGHPRRRGFLL